MTSLDLELWNLHCRRACVAVAGFAFLAEMHQTARKHPSYVGIYKPRRRRANRCGKEGPVSFEKVTDHLSSQEFKCLFRMSRVDFYELLELVRPGLTKSEEMGYRGGNATVSPAVRLSITLRMLAGTCYGDLMMLFRISKSTVYSVFHDTVGALDRALKFPLLPTTEDGLRRLADGMKLSRCRGNPLTGCIGALDGICIRIKKPRAELNPALFYCRKGYYAIPVQALVDYSYRFLCASANCVGSTHDSLAHSSSKLGIYLGNGLLDKPFYIVGDEAYICTESLLTPYPSSQVEGHIFRDAFNFYLSSMRIHVEQAFGLLKTKWLILDKLKFSTEMSSNIILLTMKLHNYCIDQKGLPKQYRSREEVARLNLEAEEWYNLSKQDYFDHVDATGKCSTFGESVEANFRDTPSTKREHFVTLLEVRGITRPNRQ